MAFGAFAPMPLRLGGSSQEGWSPEQHARVCADLVAAKFAAPFAIWTFTKSGSVITIQDYVGQNGEGLAFAPVGIAGSAGLTGFAWPSSAFVDAYGVSQSLKARHARVTAHGSVAATAAYQLNQGASVLVVATFDGADAPLDCKATVRIW